MVAAPGQQIVAYETDLWNYEDIFDGSTVIAEEGRRALKADGPSRGLARKSRAWVARGGDASAAYMKQRLGGSNARRPAAIEAGEQVVVGASKQFTEEGRAIGAAGPPAPMAASGRSMTAPRPEGFERLEGMGGEKARDAKAVRGPALQAPGKRCALEGTISWGRPRSSAPCRRQRRRVGGCLRAQGVRRSIRAPTGRSGPRPTRVGDRYRAADCVRGSMQVSRHSRRR